MAKFRIMAIDECGTECCLANDVPEQEIDDRVEEEREAREEFRSVWAEEEGGVQGFWGGF
jgi:hypothetical protein